MGNSKQFNEQDVIRIILDVAGKFNIPSNAPRIEKKKLVAHLDYTDDLLDILQIELDKYVKGINESASISDNELGNCETVGDVVDLARESSK